MEMKVQEITISLGRKAKKTILDSVSFDVREREFLSLLGASGAGKSTLLKVIAGITVQDSGAIIFDGQAIDDLAPHRRNIGFVFQDTRLFPNMNVEENIAFPCKMAGVSRKKRLEHARHLLECVQLAGFGERQVTSLSGGQQQRVALARALAAQPRVLLLDEPFSGLDEDLRDDMRSLLLRLHRDFGTATIMVTHDAVEALEMSDRIVYISKGRVLQDGSPLELYAQPQTSEIAACFGDCSTLEGSVSNGIFSVAGLELAAERVPDGPAEAVVRYQGVSLIKADQIGDRETDQEGRVVYQATRKPLHIRCRVYRGDTHLARVDIEGQTLTVPASSSFGPGMAVDVMVVTEGYFVYSL